MFCRDLVGKYAPQSTNTNTKSIIKRKKNLEGAVDRKPGVAALFWQGP
jgi:hypothetical protein